MYLIQINQQRLDNKETKCVRIQRQNVIIINQLAININDKNMCVSEKREFWGWELKGSNCYQKANAFI